jgi:hypothetical protein
LGDLNNSPICKFKDSISERECCFPMSDDDSGSIVKESTQRTDHVAFGNWIKVGCELVK